MSGDISVQFYIVYGDISGEKKKELLDYLEGLNKRLGKKLHINCERIDNSIVRITEPGISKNGSFRGVIKDKIEFVEKIISIDKDNIEVEVSFDTCYETDSKIYYYKNGKIEYVTSKTREFERLKDNKEELIKKIKEDISFFEYLTDEERKDFEYQKASMYAVYPNITREVGTGEFDSLYSEEFVKSEAAIALAFKLGTRDTLLENRILPHFIKNTELLKALLTLNPYYIKYMPVELKKDKKLIMLLIEKSKEKYTCRINVKDIDNSLYKDKEVMTKFNELYSDDWLSGTDKKLVEKILKANNFEQVNEEENTEDNQLEENIQEHITRISEHFDADIDEYCAVYYDVEFDEDELPF